MRKAMSSNQLCCVIEKISRYSTDLDLASSDLSYKTRSLDACVIAADDAASNFHREDRLNLDEAELGYPNLAAWLSED